MPIIIPPKQNRVIAHDGKIFLHTTGCLNTSEDAILAKTDIL